MPPISHNLIPNDTRRPFAFIEFDTSRAQQGPTVMPTRILVIGLRRSTSPVAQLVPKRARSYDEVASFFGSNAMIVGQAEALFKNNNVDEATFVALNAPGGGSVAEGTFVVSGPATGAGSLYAYVGGVRFQVPVAIGDSEDTIAAALAAAINANLVVPWSAAAVTDTVTLTARHAGLWGNAVDFRVNLHEDETLPSGITVVVTQPSAGAGSIDPANVWAAIGEEQYNYIAIPGLGTAELSEVEDELEDRWGPARQLDGQAFLSLDDTYGNLATLGSARNSPHLTVLGADSMPTPAYVAAAALCGLCARYLSIDPARPLQTLELRGVVPPARADRFTPEERNLLLYDGITTFDVARDGSVILERVITTSQTNAFGAESTALLDINTKATLSYLRYSLRNRLRQRYPRHKLRADGPQIPPGQAIVTPTVIRAELIAWFREMEELGLVEGIDQFKRDLIVEINAQDPNRVDILASPDLVNQMRIFGVQIPYLL